MQVVRHEVDFKTPEHIVLADKNVIINAFYRAWNVVGDTHEYVFWRMSIEQGSWKWYYDEDDNRRSKWVAKKLDDTKVRYRVNKIRRMLEGKDGRLSYQLPNGLPSNE